MKTGIIVSSILAAAMLAGPVRAEAPRGMDHHVRPMSGHVGQGDWHTNNRQRYSLAPRASYPFRSADRQYRHYHGHSSPQRHHQSYRYRSEDRRHHGPHYDRHARKHHRHYESPDRYKHHKQHKYRDDHRRHGLHDRSYRDRNHRHRQHHHGHHRGHYGPRLVQDGLTLKLIANDRVSAKIRLRSGEHWTRSNDHVVVHGGNRVIVYDSGLRLRGQRYVKRGSHLEIGSDRIVIKYGRYSDVYDYRLRLQKRLRERHGSGWSLSIR